MTLRLDEQLADEVEDVAFTLNLSQAAFIRQSIVRGLRQARELPGLSECVDRTDKS
jgi:hypothetical protein